MPYGSISSLTRLPASGPVHCIHVLRRPPPFARARTRLSRAGRGATDTAGNITKKISAAVSGLAYSFRPRSLTSLVTAHAIAV